MKCLLIPIAIGLISALLGYLLGRATTSKDRNAIAKLKAELDACKRRKTKSGVGDASKIAFDSKATKAVFGKTIKYNDLTVIEGIGPKIQDLFQKNGINTWKIMAETSIDQCQVILDKGGENFRLHTPNTWPEQAKLAHRGEWKKLLEWQKELDGGI